MFLDRGYSKAHEAAKRTMSSALRDMRRFMRPRAVGVNVRRIPASSTRSYDHGEFTVHHHATLVLQAKGTPGLRRVVGAARTGRRR